ncbi:dephospho-CoA kinase [Chondromyces crocatus]|uniref:Dephospho-CoA kinase n=1 Tax=Chondromyces crocatus TaxID=52 RepID=A0A0K1EIS0_CHOCO|nr:dephospho-CoA kinase [Chondromyces crocatus]AKT40760.1 dephospho-CoA kinase [Chondromyces crocatus]
MGFILFGLTGGLSSGKSTVARRLEAQGVPVIDADVLAREVVLPGSEGLAEVVRAFGDDVLRPDGTLDRARLAEIVFNDDDERRRLNGILHPRIGALGMSRALALRERGELVACYEAPLLVENGLADMFRPLVVVAVPEEVQVVRAMARDGATEAQARARIAAQLPLADKVAAADFVIDNSGTREDTERQIDLVLAQIRERARAQD